MTPSHPFEAPLPIASEVAAAIQGQIALAATGKHRRVRFSDLMTYKTAQEKISAAAMEELASQAQAQAQALQMGYE